MNDTVRSLGLVLFVVPAAFTASGTLPAQSLEVAAVPCKGQIISRIEVSARPPFEIKGTKFQRKFARRIADVHATTNPEVISRFLLLRPGMPCTELRRQESERILRSQPYLAEAAVMAIPDETGGVYLAVTTLDEISLVLGGSASGGVPYIRALRVGEENFMGEAQSVIGRWRYSEHFRDTYAARIIDYQFLGRPYQLSIEGSRNELGGDWSFEASHPFLTELQRYSWRTTVGSREGYRFFRRPDFTRAAILLHRTHGDIGGVVRIGPPGRLAQLGASLSYEDEMPESFPTFVGLGTTSRDTSAVLFGRYVRHKSTRINALAGVRDVSYLNVNGFESLDGAQDVRRGIEVATLIGRGITALGASEHDLFASANVYAGVGGPSAFAAFEVTAEGRRDPDTGEWDGLLASGRLATFLKPAPRHTLLSSVEWSAGWRQRIPFQLALAHKEGGPRGYRDSWLAGGRRMVARFEDHVFIGQVKQFASLGVGPFVDLGKLWAGDAPFGTDTKLNAAVGIGLLGAVPPRSQRMWRIDLVFPMNRESRAKWSVRLTSRNFTGQFWKEPGDVQVNRERSVPTSIFNWP